MSDNCILVFIFYQNHISLCTIPNFCILFEKKINQNFISMRFKIKQKEYFLCLYNEILLTTKHEEIKFVSALNIC